MNNSRYSVASSTNLESGIFLLNFNSTYLSIFKSLNTILLTLDSLSFHCV